jgi:hypothetical protein
LAGTTVEVGINSQANMHDFTHLLRLMCAGLHWTCLSAPALASPAAAAGVLGSMACWSACTTAVTVRVLQGIMPVLMHRGPRAYLLTVMFSLWRSFKESKWGALADHLGPSVLNGSTAMNP